MIKRALFLVLMLSCTSVLADRSSEQDIRGLAAANEVVLVIDASPSLTRASSQTLDMYIDGNFHLTTRVSTGVHSSTRAGVFTAASLFPSRYTGKYDLTMQNVVAYRWVSLPGNEVSVISAIYSTENRRERFGSQDTNGSIRVPTEVSKDIYNAIGSASKVKIVVHY